MTFLEFEGKNADFVMLSDISEKKFAEEKIKYQAKLVENVSDAIISTDINFNIISWNNAAERIYGWKAEEIIGKNVLDIIAVDYPKDKKESFQKQLFEEGNWKGEVIQPRNDGTRIFILSTVSLIKDDKGTPIGVVAINHDITQRKEVEQNLKDSEEKFRGLYEDAPHAYFSITPDKHIIRCNKAAVNLLGYTSEELLNMKVIELYYKSPDGIPKAMELFQEFLNGKEIKNHVEKCFKNKAYNHIGSSWACIIADNLIKTFAKRHNA